MVQQSTVETWCRVRAGALFLAVLALTVGCQAFSSDFAEFGGDRARSLRDRAAQQDATLGLRLDLLLPRLMDEAGVGCWLVLSDGQDGDPAFALLTSRASRLEGKGALLLCRDGVGLARFALGRGLAANAPIYEVVEPGEDAALEELLNERLGAADPERIGINDARSFAAADGLTAANARWLRERLAPEFVARLVSSRPVVEDFLSTLLDVEAPLFTESARFTAAILEEVLSDRVVFAAGTSLADLDWAVRDRAALIDAEVAYPPRTVIYRVGLTEEVERDMGQDLILQPGDLVFLCTGIRYLGYANRVGRWAYLLHTGEREAPDWVHTAMAELADAADNLAATLRVGQTEAEVRSAVAAVVAGREGANAVVDRVARLHEGVVDPLRRAVTSGAWRPDFRLAADTGLVLTSATTVTPAATTPQPFVMLSFDTVWLSASGVRFVLPPQRMPLLID